MPQTFLFATGSQATNSDRLVPLLSGHVEIELRGEVELAGRVLLLLVGDVHAHVEGRDVHQPGLLAVGHRLPVLAADQVRAHVACPDAQPRTLGRILDRHAGVHVHAFRPVDVDERLGGHQLAALAVEDVEEAVAVGLHQRRLLRPADVEIGEHAFVDAVEVPHVARASSGSPRRSCRCRRRTRSATRSRGSCTAGCCSSRCRESGRPRDRRCWSTSTPGSAWDHRSRRTRSTRRRSSTNLLSRFRCRAHLDRGWCRSSTPISRCSDRRPATKPRTPYSPPAMPVTTRFL